MKKVDYEHFSRFLMPHSLRTHGDDLYFCVKRANLKENRYENDLYRIRDGKTQRLTALGDVGTFRLTDDGILFPACRTKAEKDKAASGEPVTLFYLLPYDGGEALPFLTVNASAEKLIPAGENRWIYSARESLLFNEKVEENKGDKAKAAAAMKQEEDYHAVDEIPFWLNGAGYINRTRSRLHLFENGKETPLTSCSEDCEILHAEGDKLLFAVSEMAGGKMPLSNRLKLMDTKTLTVQDISLNDTGAHYYAWLLPDGTVAALINTMDKHGINQNPGLYRYAGGAWQAVYTGGLCCFGNSVGSDVGSVPGSAPLFPFKDGNFYSLDTVADHTALTAFSLDDGSIRRINQNGMNIAGFDFWKNGFAVIAMEGNGGLEVYSMSPEGKTRRLTDFNTALCKEYAYSRPMPLSFVNELGTTIGGWVIKPVNYRKGKTYPAILDIHGGPKTVYGSNYFHEMQLWASKGWFVFFCNPTGGDGLGDDFADIRGHYGDQDYRDLMTFTDLVLDTYPEIDRTRLGVTGGSYGGFMTNWIIGHTDRFKAAASQRSIANWLSFYNTSDIGYYFAKDQVDGDPWQNPEKLWAQSPLKYACNAVTPTLFIHSEEDYRCPLSEGIQMMTALRDHGTEARMCIFKGENHELSRSGKPVHRIRRLKEITEWFEKYLITK